jgi:hypothetical protein
MVPLLLQVDSKRPKEGEAGLVDGEEEMGNGAGGRVGGTRAGGCCATLWGAGAARGAPPAVSRRNCRCCFLD